VGRTSGTSTHIAWSPPSRSPVAAIARHRRPSISFLRALDRAFVLSVPPRGNQGAGRGSQGELWSAHKVHVASSRRCGGWTARRATRRGEWPMNSEVDPTRGWWPRRRASVGGEVTSSTSTLHFTAALAPGASPSCLLLACVDRGASLLNAAIPATTRRGTSRSEWRCERGEPSVEHQAGDQASEMQISICFSGNGSHQSVQISGLDFAGHRGSESQFGD
jgi:hypothetical protein